MTIVEAARTVWGSAEDHRLWDLLRTDGEVWAAAYLSSAIRRGAERRGSPREIAAADRALARILTRFLDRA